MRSTTLDLQGRAREQSDPLDDTWHVTDLLQSSVTRGNGLLPPAVPEPPPEICWRARYDLRDLLGHGSQGVVYLANRQGVDGYDTLVAVKLFYRASGSAEADYVQEMRRVARQARRVSQVQADNLIAIRDFVALEGTRVMVMEWVDGLDLRRLLDVKRLERLRSQVSPEEWERLNDVIVTPGEDLCRLQPGIAVDILRGCLAGLSALHHEGIAHCDMKPANIMVKRTGTKKVIDIDSSCFVAEEQQHQRGTPYYMAPEQLEGKPVRLRSDVASLGYVLIEMLTGKQLFREARSLSQLMDAKLALPAQLERVLPPEVKDNSILFGLINKMVAVDPKDRFPDADAADLGRTGAVSFHRHLVKTDLDTNYKRELAWWLEVLSGEPVTES